MVCLFSIALSYETLNYCYQCINDRSFSEIHDLDLDCEENKTESKSSEKTEKEGVLDNLSVDDHLFTISIDVEPQKFKSHNRFSSADYSKMIYSPPEFNFL